MKLMLLAQSSFALLGITSDQSIRNYPFNWRILLVLVSYGSSSISQLIFLNRTIKSATSFVEYSECVFVFAANILVDICYSISAFYRSKLFKYIDDCEKIVDESTLYS